MLDKSHRFCKLSESIDWASLEKEITGLMSDQYQAQWRLVSGSIYLKSFYNLSTADVIDRWSKCPYLRFFCTGDRAVEHTKAFPISPEMLEKLSLDLAGEGYDVMIKALRHPPEPSPTIH